MPFVKNPFGRIVEVPDDDYTGWITTPGFTNPSADEITTYQNGMREKVNKIKTEEKAFRENYGTPGIYFITVSQGGKDGYGIASEKIMREFKKIGKEIELHNKGQKTALLFHAPYSIMRVENPIKVIYTMFESDKIPDDWADYLEMADKIVVPSKFNQEVFKKAGFDSVVVPLGYDDQLFKYIPREIKRDTHQDFIFLHYNAFNIRKGFPEVFKAFVQEFKPDEPVKMVFKTTLPTPPIPLLKSEYPNIEVITGSMSDDDLQKLLGKSDCFVFPSRGEGFGMTPLEAMASGLPTIVPNAHGIAEYFDPDYMYEVKVKEKCTALYHRYRGITDEETRNMVGQMVICDIDDLAAKMRWIYEHEKEAKEKGKLASVYVKQWTYTKTVEGLNNVINELEKKPYQNKPVKNVLPLQQFT